MRLKQFLLLSQNPKSKEFDEFVASCNDDEELQAFYQYAAENQPTLISHEK